MITFTHELFEQIPIAPRRRLMNISIDLGWLEAIVLAGGAHGRVPRDRAAVLVQRHPAQVKAMLAIGLALAVVAPRRRAGYQSLDTGAFFGSPCCRSSSVGATLGFLVFLVFSAVQSAGNLIDLFGGFQLAQAFDPQSMINGAQFTRLFQMTALALLFASDGYQLDHRRARAHVRRAAARRRHRPRRPGRGDGERRHADVPRRRCRSPGR